MSWGLLGGLGQGMQQVGGTMQANAQDQIKEQRVKEWQQKMQQEDRQFQAEQYKTQRQDKLSDYEMQRGHEVEDRNYNAEQAARLAGIKASSTSTKLDPRVDLLDKDINRLSELLTGGVLDENQKLTAQQQLNEALQMRNQLAGLPYNGGGLLGGLTGNDADGMDDDTSSNLMSGLQRYLGNKEQNAEAATLAGREMQARNEATIIPPKDSPKLMHQSLAPQSALDNRAKYNVGSDINSMDNRKFLGLAVQALADDGYRSMPDEVRSAIIERLPVIRNQLPASLVGRAEELR